jgi:hypothetical protein
MNLYPRAVKKSQGHPGTDALFGSLVVFSLRIAAEAGSVPILICMNATNEDQIQGVIESCTDILTTSYWLHVELGKNI